jgi:hypothetical protein
MIDDDGVAAARGVAIALKHLLRRLERRGILSPTETETLLDGAFDEIRKISALKGDALWAAARAIGVLHLPVIGGKR